MLFPAIRRAQVPLGISKITSRDSDLMGVSVAHAAAPTAILTNKIPDHLTYLMDLLLDCGRSKKHSLLQQYADVMREVVSAVPVRHQGAKAPAPIDQIDV